MEDKIGEVIDIIMNNKSTIIISIFSAWLIVFYILLFVDKATCDKISKMLNIFIILSCIILVIQIFMIKLGGI